MRTPRAPRLEARRAPQFTAELQERARIWIPSWGLADGERDFGRALLAIAARFSSEVAERLDGAGDKMKLGFLDWLAMRGEAARPSRMPVVFKLTDSARDPVAADAPVRLQIDVQGAPVVFETETDVRVVAGHLDQVVAVSPDEDAFYLPPPGLSDLGPLDPLPARWQLKSFAAAGAEMLQLDPGLGLAENMLVQIDGQQYRIAGAPNGDLITIEPSIPAGDGLAVGTEVTKVSAFDPFAGARNQQNHILYLGHADLFNIEARSTIDVVGAEGLGSGVTWEYWGKEKSDVNPPPPTDDVPSWRTLLPAEAARQKADALVLDKQKGAIEPVKVGQFQSRWIRARKANLPGADPVLTTDSIEVRINAPSPGPPPDPLEPMPDAALLPPVDVIVNTTPSTANDFYPLGREPRMFDAFYLGCPEVFSKPGAHARVRFDLSELEFEAMSLIDAGPMGVVLAGVDKAGALHLLNVKPDGTLERLHDRGPQRPDSGGGQGAKLTSTGLRPALWLDSDGLNVAVLAGNDVWVWHESGLDPSTSSWLPSLGAPPEDTDPNSRVTGLVVVVELLPGTPRLVALRDGKLSSPAPGGAGWAPSDALLGGLPVSIASIASTLLEGSRLPVCEFIAVLSDGRICSAISTPSISLQELPGARRVATHIVPFSIFRPSTFTSDIVAIAQAQDKWIAWRSAQVVDVDIEARFRPFDPTFIDGRVEGGELTAYILSQSTSDPIDLLAWRPFDAGLASVVFRIGSDATVGTTAGAPVLFGDRAYIAGRADGKILAAVLDGTRPLRNATAADFRSALATRATPMPAANDTVAVRVAGNLETALVTLSPVVEGRDGFAGERFVWLDHWLARDTAHDDAFVYSTSVAPSPFSANVENPPIGPIAGATYLRLPANGPLVAQGAFLLVDDIAPQGRHLVRIVELVGTRAAVLPALSEVVPNPVPYWAPTTIDAQVFPGLELAALNNNWDVAALRFGDVYFPGSSPTDVHPRRQHVIAVATDTATPPNPQWLAFEAALDVVALPAGLIAFVVDGSLTAWVPVLADTSSNPALAWEYWNGTGWWRLAVQAETTNNLKNSGHVVFDVPSDLKATDWAGKTSNWIRARLVGGDYGHETVIVKTTPLPSPAPAGSTEQVVERSTEGIQPPYALNVWVRYEIDTPIAPTYLLTQDSGTLRDQSDANRSSGAQVEILTPLATTLRRLEGRTASTATPGAACVGDCNCATGDASTSSGSEPATTPLPSTAAVIVAPAPSRAIFLGFDDKLSGTPVNVLLLVDRERPFDAIAPINADALVGNHFVPVVVDDTTRALGESGLLSMSFAVEPIPTELFGKTLSWLRLSPSGVDPATPWDPGLKGAYLNAVWASARETLTRELLGSSEGAPNLTLHVARPPILRNTLELRVKEPLGEEERDLLRKDDPDIVLSDDSNLPGDWVLWKQVNDPGDAGPTERVYALDEGIGEIRFGDGRHGAIPPVGRDSIVAFAYQRTEVGALGGDDVPGNSIAPRMPLNLISPVESVEAVFSADQAAGGAPPEAADRVLRFGAARLRHRERAVTSQDFEDLVLESSPHIVQTRCFVGPGRVRVVVVMRGADPQPNAAQVRELKRLLQAAVPASLDAKRVLQIEGPAVRRLRIELRLRVAGLEHAGVLGRAAKQQVTSFFDTSSGGVDGTGWPLGASPSQDDIALALVDAPNLEGIGSVALREIVPGGDSRPLEDPIKANELVMLDDDGVRTAFEIVETAA